ncbi:hypothetical protein BY458DRAFT_530320 [Sporodiniella umbellata]|nr:hypothetical protein BY458DRAFT_530320 [Sporodiniella umbellata]
MLYYYHYLAVQSGLKRKYAFKNMYLCLLLYSLFFVFASINIVHLIKWQCYFFVISL